MTTTLLLRISAVISLLFAIGHSLGGLKRWSPMGDNEVLKSMETVRFDTMGANRSYLDFFMGFGWSHTLPCCCNPYCCGNSPLWRAPTQRRYGR